MGERRFETTARMRRWAAAVIFGAGALRAA
jgi:hypothetical protein